MAVYERVKPGARANGGEDYLSHDLCHPHWAVRDFKTAWPVTYRGERLCWSPLYGDAPCVHCGELVNEREPVRDLRTLERSGNVAPTTTETQ